jgi:ribosomal protein S12 methylthiotransferase accessory factor
MAPNEIRVSFGDGLKVNAEYKGFVIQTDQPVHQGGLGTAPAPFDLFLASIATCAGFYALAFCQERHIPVGDLGVTMIPEKGPVSKMIEKITITIDLPTGFPEKYKPVIMKAVDQCTVKAHMLKPPQFEIVARQKE